MIDLKVATWNMNYWQNSEAARKEAWQYVLEQLKPDIFLFQEGNPTQTKLDKNKLIYSALDRGSRSTWGNGIYCPNYDIEPIFIEKSFSAQGSLVLGSIYIPQIKASITLISLYGVLETIGSTSWVMPNLHRMISDLTGTLTQNRNNYLILAGDFNASLQWDSSTSNHHEIFFNRLKAFGLRSVYQLAGKTDDDYEQTLNKDNSSIPWQNDYIFLSKTLSQNFDSYEVIKTKQLKSLSDHNLLLTKLKL